MTEVTSADLVSAPAYYQSSRALNDVLIGEDSALPLFEASSGGHVTTLRTILDKSPEIALDSPHRIYMEDRPTKDRNDVRGVRAAQWLNVDRAILRAAESGQIEAVSILLDFASRNGLKPLSVIDRDTVKVALQKGDVALFDVLATADSIVAIHNDIHPTERPLDWAIRTSNIELVKVILRHGGGQIPLTGRSHPISYALRGGSRLCNAAKKSKTMTELLIQHGYAVQGSGALQAAASSGKLDTIRLLVDEHGADVNERLPAESLPAIDKPLYASWTPLHFAASRARGEAMELLESYGANADALDLKGRTASQLAQEWKEGRSFTKTIVR
nr:isoform 4 of ankyrin-2 [Quercus suber]